VDPSSPPGNAGAAPPPPADEPAPPDDAPGPPAPGPATIERDAPLQAAPAAALVATLPPAPVSRPPVWRRWWLWTAVGAVVAGVVVAAAVIARPASSTCAATLGCARE
jgi:hypothetical protein